jgi:hypothetical protein
MSVHQSDRDEVIRVILPLIRALELRKSNPVDDETMNKGVVDWELKLYTKFGHSREEYLAKFNAKREQCKSLSKPVVVHRKIEELREPLEQTRLMMRTLFVFAAKKKEHKLREEFMGLYDKITSLVESVKKGITKYKSEDVEKLLAGLAVLREKLRPHVKDIQVMLNAETAKEVLDIDLIHFGYLERIAKVSDNSRFKERCRNASALLGGFHALKRQRGEDE